MASYIEEMREWERNASLPPVRIDTAATDAAIGLSVEAIKALTPEDAFAHAWVLAQFAFMIQRRLNQCNAFITWAKLNRGHHTEDPEVTADRVRRATVNVDRLSYLARRVEFMSEVLMRIHKMKRSDQ